RSGFCRDESAAGDGRGAGEFGGRRDRNGRPLRQPHTPASRVGWAKARQRRAHAVSRHRLGCGCVGTALARLCPPYPLGGACFHAGGALGLAVLAVTEDTGPFAGTLAFFGFFVSLLPRCSRLAIFRLLHWQPGGRRKPRRRPIVLSTATSLRIA